MVRLLGNKVRDTTEILIQLKINFNILTIIGLHPESLQGLFLPSFKTKERAQSQQKRHQGFGGAYRSEALS